MSYIRFAEGSGGQELSVSPACVRACDAYMRIGRSADQLSAALDGITQPGHYQRLDDEDSLVVVLRDFIPADASKVIDQAVPAARAPATGKKPEIGG